jgi:hemoglobin/transferrin/lactoferrin receptor protein
MRGAYDVSSDGSGKLFFGVGQAFRAPNLSDLTRFDLARSSEIELPSPDVQPERYLSYELGSRWGDSKSWQVEAWVFKTQIENMIIKSQTGEKTPDGKKFYVVKKNSGKGYVQGAELDGFYRVTPEYVLGGNYTFQWGELETYPTTANQTKVEPLSRVMPATLNLNARYEGPNDRYWVEALYTLVRRQDRINSGDKLDNERIPPGGSPGYKTYGLRAGGALSSNARMSLAFRRQRTGTKRYRDVGCEIIASGFTDKDSWIRRPGLCRLFR